MNKIRLLVLLYAFSTLWTQAQQLILSPKQKQDLHALIDQYALAREKKDTMMLKEILLEDVDQLVSTGEWRIGIGESVKGMLRSSESSVGSRKLIVDKVRLLNSVSAVVDARYEIQNQDGTLRKMWSTFIVVYSGDKWKISAIRNMLPQR